MPSLRTDMGKQEEQQHISARKLTGAPDLLALARGESAAASNGGAPQFENRKFWRTLDQAHDTDAHKKATEDEFPHRESLKAAIERRDFLKLMGATTVMAGLAGCRNLPVEKIVPYVKPPEEFVPGKPLQYATSFVHAGYAIGVLAESHMGRPTKLEGNPEHPASLGSTDAITSSIAS